jgi:catechol 2,3-dioxygenase
MKYSTPSNTKIGHVHLKVANLDRSLKFYCDILGFHVKQRIGDQVAFIAAGNYHHHIGLNTWESKNGHPPALGTTGLYHTAILYPTRKDLAQIYKRLNEHYIELTGAADHGVSEALYLNDPDENGVELYWDKPEKLWPYDSKGNLNMITAPLDLDELLKA